jgi:serine phosphatase RsbU (regulator of sigma subunit)
MRIRTQLILAAFVLAVLPLAAIVTYSYHSSRRALESAYRGEAERLTKQMDRRLASIRAELDQRVRYVGALPMPAGGSDGDGSIATVMGEAAPFVNALDFEPIRVMTGNAAAAKEAKSEPAQESGTEASETPDTPAAPPAAAAPPVPTERVVIELPPMPEFPRYSMSEEQQELIAELGTLGARIGDQALDADEREDLRQQIREAEESLRKVVVADRAEYIAQMREAQDARRNRMQKLRQLSTTPVVASVAPAPRTPDVAATPAVASSEAAAPAPAPRAKVKVREATATDVESAVEHAKKASLIFGRSFKVPVRQEGEVVGELTARISAEHVIGRILGNPNEESDELPFAVDREGSLYTRNDKDRQLLTQLGIPELVRSGRSVRGIEGWIVSVSTDTESGLKIGAARPVGENLGELRSTAARNFVLGVGLIAFAVIGVIPLSNHLTRDVAVVTEGAERIAHGDLMTRLPVKTGNELGQLARAFNQMAEDLSVHQQKLVEQERARKEQELNQRLMSVEYERKSIELEEARRFQLSMLPKHVPQHDAFGVAVFTRTATEVGGDYYDFHVAGDTLSITIGDATGHGARAGTMVTVIKTLFAGYSAATAPSHFLFDAAEKIRRMELGRMAMALSVARFDQRRLTISSAGMPPVLVHRAESKEIEEIVLAATPLGTMGDDYPEATVDLLSGDTVLFLTDGFPELMNDAGQQLGYAAAAEAFASAAGAATADDVIASLSETARRWHGELPPNDDVTFVVVRVA